MIAPSFIENRITPFLVLILLLFASACADTHEEHGEEHADDHAEESGEEHAEDSPEPGVIELEPEMLERITIREAAVAVRNLPAELLTTGQVDFEQDRLAHVTPRIPGRVEEVHARFSWVNLLKPLKSLLVRSCQI